jgi:hypothetical protein
LASIEADAVDHSWLSGFVFIPTVMNDLRCDDGGKQISLITKADVCDIDFSEK